VEYRWRFFERRPKLAFFYLAEVRDCAIFLPPPEMTP